MLTDTQRLSTIHALTFAGCQMCRTPMNIGDSDSETLANLKDWWIDTLDDQPPRAQTLCPDCLRFCDDAGIDSMDYELELKRG